MPELPRHPVLLLITRLSKINASLDQCDGLNQRHVARLLARSRGPAYLFWFTAPFLPNPHLCGFCAPTSSAKLG